MDGAPRIVPSSCRSTNWTIARIMSSAFSPHKPSAGSVSASSLESSSSAGDLGHKNVLHPLSRWLGYMVDINEATAWLPDDKLTALLPALKKLEADLQGRKEVTSLLGRLQWVAKAFPSHRQPLYAWEQKLQRRCRPSQLVRYLATSCCVFLTVDLVLLHKLRAGPCHGSSDAGESQYFP